ncbi:MAG TPA: O-antigen ligase family protein [Candidatus Brocadiia bacterium]|nr:O-antigen ligase family protein [Candidatus Brocadiales bacterium]
MKFTAGLLIFATLFERGKISLFMKVPQNLLLFIIILLMFLSIPFAISQGQSLSGCLGFCKIVIIYLIFLNLVQKPRDLKIVMWVIFLSTIHIVFLSIKFYVSGQTESRFGIERSGFYGDQNDLASFLITTIPLLVGLIQLSKSFVTKIVLGCGIGAYLLGTLATQSKGGLIGLLVVGLGYIIKSNKKLTAIMLCGFMAVMLYTIIPASAFHRFSSITSIETADSASLRIELWKSGLKMVKDNPLFGVGVNCFPRAIGTIYNLPFRGYQQGWFTAHNSFILIMAEVGIFAFLCYILLYYVTFKDLKMIKTHLLNANSAEETKELFILTKSFELSLIGFTVCSLFLSHTYRIYLYIIIASIIIIKQWAKNSVSPPQVDVGLEPKL